EEEVDLVYIFGLERNKAKEIFPPSSNFLFFEKNSSLISNFVSACHLLKSNKANVIFFISLCPQPGENPFLSQKDFLLDRAREFGITKPLMDEIFLKSYFKYEYFYSKELFKEEFQPVIANREKKEIFLKDHFFYQGTTRENLNLAEMKSSLPWEIFSDFHFSPGASGGCAMVLVNEEVAKEKNLKNLCEIGFYNFLTSKRNPFPLNLLEAFSQCRDFSYRAALVSTPCLKFEAFTRSFFSNGAIQKEYLGTTISLEEINPYGGDLFSGWIEGASFLRRIGFLKNYILSKKGRGILIEIIPSGPEFFMEMVVE
ncbi:MAG: hypothetical protein WHV67_06790, partial [Thermoanaerobaculia bacterium]